jgi:molecular chaperone GrpE
MIPENEYTSHTSHDEQRPANDQSHGPQQEPNQTHLQEALNACRVQVGEWQDKYLRVNADLDNVNRRAAKDRALAQHTAQVALLLPLLTIVDDFERALEQQQQGDVTDVHKWREGISMIYASLQKYLSSVGVEPIKEYDQFDPELHEALTSVASDTHASGSIVSVLQKGYRFKGSPLRPAKVSVAQ